MEAVVWTTDSLEPVSCVSLLSLWGGGGGRRGRILSFLMLVIFREALTEGGLRTPRCRREAALKEPDGLGLHVGE